MLALAGCESLSYYAQAIEGQLQMMHRAQPVAEWISNPATPPALRKRLELARRIRNFASRELALPDNGSYRSYADLGRPYAVWNVFAAPEFSVKPVQSCFLVAGCVAYRGFFARDDAERYAEKLRKKGLDVFVYGVPAYSTLGWFDDPLLSTFIQYPDWELARLIFHELAHQLVYVKGDTTFNESFAVTVQDVGVGRWLASQKRASEIATYRKAEARYSEFVKLIDNARARLARLYAEPLEPPAMRAAKRAEFRRLERRYAGLKARWGGYSGYDYLMAKPNNALLASISAYSRLVPAFRHELAAVHGNLRAFYAKVKALALMPKRQRDAVLEGLIAARRGSPGISTRLRMPGRPARRPYHAHIHGVMAPLGHVGSPHNRAASALHAEVGLAWEPGRLGITATCNGGIAEWRNEAPRG